MAMRGVHHQEVDGRRYQHLRALVGVIPHPDGGADHQPSIRVLGCPRILLTLGEVLDRDQSAQAVTVVHQGKLLNLVLAQQQQRVVRGHPDPRRDERHRCHDRTHQPGIVPLKSNITIRDNSHEPAIRFGHRNPGNAVAGHELVGVLDGGIRAAGNRRCDHP